MNQLVPYSEEWKDLRAKLAISFCPPIYPCKKCNHPVIDGYICTHCKDPNPNESEDLKKEN
jgi:hypothetical protein